MILTDPYVLDDDHAIEAADPAGVVRAIANAPALLRAAAFAAGEADLSRLRDASRPRALLVVGTGPAAEAGRLLAALAAPASSVPVLVGADVPAWVGAGDLVVAVSGDGTSRDVIGPVETAVRRGVPVVAVGPDPSPLAGLVRSGRGDVVALPVVPGFGIWPQLAALVVIAEAVGAVRMMADLDPTADLLDVVTEQCKPAKESFLNPGKELALALATRVPLILGASALTLVAARRAVRQLGELAAVPAVASASAGAAAALLADPEAAERLTVVVLPDPVDAQGSPESVDALRDLVADRRVPLHELAASGESPLQRTASSIAVLDFAAAYAALARGIDPNRLREGIGR